MSHRIPASLARRFKVACIERDIKQHTALAEAIEAWIEQGG